MNLKILFSICAVLFMNSVSSRASDDILGSILGVRRLSRQSYQYNHPPAFETSQAIPVAVVYDDESHREEKSIKDTKQDNMLTTTQTEEKTTESSRRKVVRKKVFKKPSETEQQIPVLVVYDEDPKISEHNYNKARRSQRNRQRQTTQRAVDTKQENKTDPEKDTINKSVPSKRRERPVVPIVGSENHVYAHTGEFMYSYEGGDGTRAFESGKLKSYEDEKSGEAVQGGFSYTDKDGKDFSLMYTADENGYRPVGAHLPTPPPIPPAIARALAYLATKNPETTTESHSIPKKRN